MSVCYSQNRLKLSSPEGACQVPDFRRQVGGAFGEWLEGMADWDWYATLTFRNPENPRYPSWSQVGWLSAHRALRQLNSALVSRIGDNPLWVGCMELQQRGVPHWHLLVSNVAQEKRLSWVDWWYERFGIARIFAYDKSLGARYYLGKYLTKSVADIRFSPALMASLGRR